MSIRDLALILLTLMLTGCSAMAPQPDSTPAMITRAVEIRKRDRLLVSTEGRVSDGRTGMTIPTNAPILVVTVTGSYEFMGGLFEVSFPAETLANIRAKAPGAWQD